LEAPPQDLRQSRNEEHFQPEARNEVLKEFWLKLTPMNAVAPPCRREIKKRGFPDTMKNECRDVAMLRLYKSSR